MIPEFALRLICGLSTAWCVAPRGSITSGFFRIQMLLTLGLSVLTAVTAGQAREGSPGRWEFLQPGVFATGMVLAVLAFLGSMMWTLERRVGGARFGGMIAIVSTTMVLILGGTGGTPGRGVWMASLDALSSAWLLGAVTAAMLLGHWYLTAKGMSLEPLVQYNLMFGAATCVRIAFVVADSGFGPVGADGNLLLWILRWGGLAGPLILFFLIRQILRYRNTQSATGVLYAATILAFMGEMAAVLIARAQAIPQGV